MEPLSSWGIFSQIIVQFWPVWIALVVFYIVSYLTKSHTGLFGKLFHSPIGLIGLGIVMFWVFTALFADLIITFDPYGQISGMKNKIPGTPVRGLEGEYYLLGVIVWLGMFFHE